MSDQPEQTTQKQFNNPVSIAKRSNQRVHAVERSDKASMLAYIIKNEGIERAVVITKTKRDADALSAHLQSQKINAAALHGNKSKEACERAANAFQKQELTVLITTDMIFQALKLQELPYIVSYDLPADAEHYLSRMGSLSEKGLAIALVSPDENSLLYTIERIMKRAIPQEDVEGFTPSTEAPMDDAPKRQKNMKEKPRHRVQKRKTGPKTRDDNETRGDKKSESKPYKKKPSDKTEKTYGKKPSGDDRKPSAKKAPSKKKPIRKITLEEQKKK
jgi:ATP-dependent RNA helicase RhlE